MSEVEEVGRIAALPDPVIRNLQITECYSRLAAAVADGRPGANWCTFATWASRQAGSTIRGEDMLDLLQRELGRDAELLHPIASLWRALLRRGLLNRTSRLGRVLWSLHTPFDAFELAVDPQQPVHREADHGDSRAERGGEDRTRSPGTHGRPVKPTNTKRS